MNPTDIVQATIWQDGDATNMARVKFEGTVTSFKQANIASIVRTTFDTEGATPETATDTTSLTVSASVFDDLQNDGRWTEDATGYNFRDTIGGSLFPDDHVYRVEYLVTSTGGSVFVLAYELDAQKRWAS